MAKTSDWANQPVDTLDLQLDPNNYRLPPHLKGLSQPKLLDILITGYDVLDIASSISDKGFFPHELPIVVKEKGKYVVVEGNRRLAACKALLLPENLPDGHRKKFMQLSATTDKNSIKKLSVVVAPSREAAVDLIESLHTSPGRLKWDTLAKARFDKEHRSSNKSKLTEANRILDTYTVASTLPLPDEIKSIVQNEGKFNVTNLIRIFNDEHTKKYLGYDYDTKGNLVIKIRPREFINGAVPIVSDVATSKNFSRETDKADDRKKYIDNKKKKVSVDTSHHKSLSVDEFISQIEKDTPSSSKHSAASARSKSPAKAREPKNIIPYDFTCTVSHTRIKKVFKELSGLPIEKFPNATAITLRLLLEISLFQFLEKTGEYKKLKKDKADRAKSKNQSLPAQWTPELREMLKWLGGSDLEVINGHIQKKIQKIASDDIKDPALYDLNQFVHNPEEIPDPASLRKTWMSLEAIMKILLNPDGTKS